jgi:hypothetical protein
MRSAFASPRQLVTGTALALLLAAILACNSIVGGDLSFSEACVGTNDCKLGMTCETVVPAQVHKQCTMGCTVDSDCQKVDGLGVCHAETCVLSCGKDSDCPAGASCSSQIGGGCYQN